MDFAKSFWAGECPHCKARNNVPLPAPPDPGGVNWVDARCGTCERSYIIRDDGSIDLDSFPGWAVNRDPNYIPS